MTPGTVTIDGAVRNLGDTRRLTVGSAPDNGIVVDHPLVGAHHLSIEWRGDGWWVMCDDPATPAYAAGSVITQLLVASSARVRLGDPDIGPALYVVLGATGEQPTTAVVDGILTIGRTPENDVVVDDPLVSRHHARVIAHGDGLILEDLGSSNGTYVDGDRIAHARLAAGTTITIGNTDFLVSGRALVRRPAQRIAAPGGGGLHVRGVGLTVDGGKRLLDDIEFTARPGTVTAVIGPSGAGKSTVSSIAAGIVRPTEGAVCFEGHDVHADYDALRTRIGMVPQQDVLHHKLTLRQALGFAAELRLPPDLSDDDRRAVIADVLTELQLLDHVDTRIDKLSGGQRKRASVAMELLTGPSLLILDEPTSGLDPALDRQVMASLRRLADAGRVVLVVTHSLTHLAMCDQVLLLAPGGRTAYLGSPEGVSAAMGTGDWAEIFAHVSAYPSDAHREHLRRSGSCAGARDPALRSGSDRAGRLTAAPQSGVIRQCSTVARRHCRVILADPGYLGFLAVMPVVLGLLTLVIPGSVGFGVNRVADTAGEALQILVILVIGATFMGTAITVRDLVGERDIFERERAVGLRPDAYLAAKIVVYVAVVALQTAVMITITYLGKGMPTAGVVGFAPLELVVSLSAIGAVGVLVGLAISVTVRSTEQTMPPLVILVISQLVFSGGLFRLTTPGLAQLSWLFPSYWGYATSAGAVDLTAIAPLAPQTAGAAIWEPTLLNATLGYSVLLLMSVVLVSYTVGRLTRER
ncbi:ATP-binding cassette domain-containing protein [Gordonia sp. OPL2]|uniref:ATP-binding cassette domain-containing protein n=1 Tax=Gordonia sp. OPL2 TaxID=2486274 RepID=UPI00165523C6|nr:ATP-binding cassette domain-containing protein [Gordonia sp. OPL2]RPA12505.1 ATP-binding cassette domain-containing protein [Gordonia sp. OPL2]